MSSSHPFPASSPLSPTSSGPRRPKSRFTYRHLAQLAASQPASPLRVVAHIDLDAFYAQCETVRLGLSAAQPLAVQQWQGLIAINYAARAFGLSRHVTAAEARRRCPELVCQHVATWREGDARWAYHGADEAARNMAAHKVSLDPYRTASRAVLARIRDALPPPPLQRVEKASIDEVFMDLSAQVHGVLLERFPDELARPPPYDDPTELLPRPPTTALDWQADHLVDLDDGETEVDDPDWDDVAMLVGSEIVRDVRASIFEGLKYTCSGGVARNKMLAKLGSGYKKPNQQTVIRNRAVQNFLSDMKFTKIRNLGGKLGDEVVAMFNTETVKELLDVPLEQLQRLGDGTGIWLYDIIRGNDLSEVNPRMQIKSMLSAKSFRPSINTFEQGTRWLRIFCADIFSRCVEEGVLENKRRPKTINLHHRHGQQTRSKQSPIPQARTFSEEMLFDLAKALLAQVVADGRAWPCTNLSLSVGGFEDGITGNQGIGNFLVRGEEAKAMLASERGSPASKANTADPLPPQKKRRIDEGGAGNGIQRFFGPRQPSRDDGDDGDDGGDDDDNAHNPAPTSRENSRHHAWSVDDRGHDHDHDDRLWDEGEEAPASDRNDTTSPPPPFPSAQPQHHQPTPDTFACPRCAARLPAARRAEHADYHVAKDLARQLQAEDREAAAAAAAAASASSSSSLLSSSSTHGPARGRGRPPGGGGGSSL